MEKKEEGEIVERNGNRALLTWFALIVVESGSVVSMSSISGEAGDRVPRLNVTKEH